MVSYPLLEDRLQVPGIFLPTPASLAAIGSQTADRVVPRPRDRPGARRRHRCCGFPIEFDRGVGPRPQEYAWKRRGNTGDQSLGQGDFLV